MRTQAIALAVLLCSGAALAQNPLGDDSGPNANDGQCDDTRFENIGVGNSNIVFWEGGRYDGRDASDCRDLLLQGLINWRDGVDPRVDEVLATGEFGDDSGPNANNGECDDTRFENIGVGNSNIVFWEGGRYDGRDATDCADLLLQGLIAWRRDTAVAGVPVQPELPTVAETPQQPATTLPNGVTAESICPDNPEGQACWMELDNIADCYIWNSNPQQSETVTWSAQCSSGLVNGTGTDSWTYGPNGENSQTNGPGPYHNGKRHGTWTFQYENRVVNVPFINGQPHGKAVERRADGRVIETPWVNGERHGQQVERMPESDDYRGWVVETPWTNDEIHGTRITRYAWGNVVETPYVNGERHGMEISRHVDGRVIETPYVNGQIHGTRIARDPSFDDRVVETPYVNGEKHGTEITRDSTGFLIETPWIDGVEHGTVVIRRNQNARVVYFCYRNGEEFGNGPCQ